GAAGRERPLALAAEPAEHPARVVGLALLRVRERVVGALDLLELLLGAVVVGVAIRVVPAGELAVGLLDFIVGGLPRDAEHLVEVVSQGRPSLAHDYTGRSDQLVSQAVALL